MASSLRGKDIGRGPGEEATEGSNLALERRSKKRVQRIAYLGGS